VGGSRREFVGFMLALVPGAAGLTLRPAISMPRAAGTHPNPRPGVDGSRVLTAADLRDAPDVVPVFDMIREIPRVADGIRCQCECAELPEIYSLLSCYEGDGMARQCHICQGVARLAYRMHGHGKSLNEVRAAVDAETWG
jgi:hypothetical protein